MYSHPMQVDGFRWDDGNRDKCQKHGVSIEEIEALFNSGDLIVLPDPFEHEERLRGVGRSIGGRYIFVVWTLRETTTGRLVRAVSARYMHAKEINHYEQTQR